MEVEKYLLNLEINLMLGGGRWVAEFNESFRNFSTGQSVFDLFVRGGTRTRGFLLSRLFAYFSLPEYKVGLYAKHLPDNDFKPGEMIEEVKKRGVEQNIKWSWLVMFRKGKFLDSIVERVCSFNNKDTGIALVNIDEQDIDTSSNLLGHKAVALVRAFK